MRINDYGLYDRGRTIDMSAAAREQNSVGARGLARASAFALSGRPLAYQRRWIEFAPHKSLPSKDQSLDQSFARLAVPFPRTFCWQLHAARTHQKRTS